MLRIVFQQLKYEGEGERRRVEEGIKNKVATSRKLSGKSVNSLVGEQWGGLLRGPGNRLGEREREAEMHRVLLAR